MVENGTIDLILEVYLNWLYMRCKNNKRDYHEMSRIEV